MSLACINMSMTKMEVGKKCSFKTGCITSAYQISSSNLQTICHQDLVLSLNGLSLWALYLTLEWIIMNYSNSEVILSARQKEPSTSLSTRLPLAFNPARSQQKSIFHDFILSWGLLLPNGKFCNIYFLIKYLLPHWLSFL